jgi:hypothetical protein
MDGRSLVRLLASGSLMPRPAYIPLLGDIARTAGQVSAEDYTNDAQVQASVLAQVGEAFGADAIVAGLLGTAAVGLDVVARLKGLRPGTGLAGWVVAGDGAATRAYSEAGVDLLLVGLDDGEGIARLRTQANAARFYAVPIVLVAPALQAGPIARAAGMSGYVTEQPDPEAPEIIGVPLTGDAGSAQLRPPRQARFFWTSAGPIGAHADVDKLAALGRGLS